jgi:hypothetical protein
LNAIVLKWFLLTGPNGPKIILLLRAVPGLRIVPTGWAEQNSKSAISSVNIDYSVFAIECFRIIAKSLQTLQSKNILRMYTTLLKEYPERRNEFN